TPPERDIEWTEAGAEGAWRFTQRLWRAMNQAAQTETGSEPDDNDSAATALRRATHKTLESVTEDISQLRFNRAIARIYELSNSLAQVQQDPNRSPGVNWAIRESATILVQMFAPMMPHLAEECWKLLGQPGIVVEAAWPETIEALLVDDAVTIAIQVNGKRRDEISLQKGMPKEEIESTVLQLDNIQRVLSGQTIRKVIVVPDRIVNIVAS
ncbi:MAG: class I tRNA ligase family protein, partial [Aestuariivirgaceae bacterium]